jgi:hypothetical protein
MTTITILPESNSPENLPDESFSAEKQVRLKVLMRRWREARDVGSALSAEESDELEALVQVELKASEERSRALIEVARPL